MKAFKDLMGSRPVVGIVRAGATLFLAVVLVAAGFAACLMPASTDGLANATVASDLSPFGHDELVKGANATRDYSFFSHDEHALLATIYEMNQTLPAASKQSTYAMTRPQVASGVDASALSTEELRSALLGSNVAYTLDAEALSHLDDVYHVAWAAYVAIGIIVILLIAAVAHVVFYRGWRGAWSIFAVAGGLLIVVFAIAGIWALMDFYGFFMTFHTLFFTGDSWVFPYDCLLICMLPEDFWMGMGAIWLITTMVLSILSVIIGILLRRKPPHSKEIA